MNRIKVKTDWELDYCPARISRRCTLKKGYRNCHYSLMGSRNCKIYQEYLNVKASYNTDYRNSEGKE